MVVRTSLAVRAASGDDARLIAQMNKRLIEDEGSRNLKTGTK